MFVSFQWSTSVWLKLLFLFNITLLLLWVYQFQSAQLNSHIFTKFFNEELNATVNNSCHIPIILAWTSYFNLDLSETLNFTSCSHRCLITNNRSILRTSDAVVFHIRNTSPKDLPKFRSSKQYFVFFSQESPVHTGNGIRPNSFEKNAIPNDYFNLTMTYRLDSDIYIPYGKLEKVHDNSVLLQDYYTFDEAIKKRNKAVLQFVSNCKTHSNREGYTALLKRYISVTQIGKCGIRNCSKKCEKLAMDEHKFYLSFENSICRDYVTEKLYSQLGKFLPVVLKRSIYSNIVPNDAFIAADDFNTPKELANYLKYLHINHTAFMKYFEWAKYYRKIDIQIGCELCKKIYELAGEKKIVKELRKWWFEDGDCQQMKWKFFKF